MAKLRLLVVADANGRHCSNDCRFMATDAKRCQLFDVDLIWNWKKKTNGNVRPVICRKAECLAAAREGGQVTDEKRHHLSCRRSIRGLRFPGPCTCESSMVMSEADALALRYRLKLAEATIEAAKGMREQMYCCNGGNCGADAGKFDAALAEWEKGR